MKQNQSASKASVNMLEKQIRSAQDAIRKEAAARRKAEMEIDSVKNLVRSVQEKAAQENAEMKMMVKQATERFQKEHKKTDKKIKALEEANKFAEESIMTLTEEFGNFQDALDEEQ